MKALLIALSVLTLAGCQDDKPKSVKESIRCAPYEGSIHSFQFYTSNGHTTSMYIDGILQKTQLVRASWATVEDIVRQCIVKERKKF